MACALNSFLINLTLVQDSYELIINLVFAFRL